MRISEIEQGLTEYTEAFDHFRTQFSLPREWFGSPDHVAIKCADEVDYLQTLGEVAALTEDRKLFEYYDEEGERSLSTGFLLAARTICEHNFYVVEIMQPRPGNETETGYVEHTEFTFRDFFAVEQFLRVRGIDHERQRNPGHDWVNIPISSDDRLELKINDRPLKSVVDAELLDGRIKERKF